MIMIGAGGDVKKERKKKKRSKMICKVERILAQADIYPTLIQQILMQDQISCEVVPDLQPTKVA